MTSVDICNLALSYLGDSATVASIDPPEGSAQAQHCARFYPIALDLMLEQHQWNFITKRVQLAVVADAAVDGWRYVYGLPSDVADMISVLPKTCYPQNLFDLAIASYYGYWPFQWERDYVRDFQIEIVGGAQVILSNACEAIARYTCTTVQPGMFPAQFTNALARLLASMLAGPILKNDAGAAEGKRQYAFYEEQAMKARAQDANQRHDQHQSTPSNIMARR